MGDETEALRAAHAELFHLREQAVTFYEDCYEEGSDDEAAHFDACASAYSRALGICDRMLALTEAGIARLEAREAALRDALELIAEHRLVRRSFSDYRDSFHVMRDSARAALAALPADSETKEVT